VVRPHRADGTSAVASDPAGAAGSIPPDPAPRRGRRWLARHAPALGFLGRFSLLLAAFQGVVLLPWADRAYYGCLCANARVAGAALRGCGEDVNVSGIIIRTAGYAVAIQRGCDAIEPAWFFCAAVLAFPLPWRLKWPGLLAGSAILFAVNLSGSSACISLAAPSPSFPLRPS